MRLWSVHPKYFDVKGLTACWREGLLARKVLLGQTKGYRKHPQLIRFRATVDPIAAIDVFLAAVLAEACSRGYNYDATKIDILATSKQIEVTQGQLDYEHSHLQKKLSVRDISAYEKLKCIAKISPNPVFIVIDGDIEDWEIIKKLQ